MILHIKYVLCKIADRNHFEVPVSFLSFYQERGQLQAAVHVTISLGTCTCTGTLSIVTHMKIPHKTKQDSAPARW